MSKIGPLLSEGHWCLEAGKQNASFKTSGGRHRNIVLSVQDENEKKREKELNHVFLPPAPLANTVPSTCYCSKDIC